MPVYFGLPVTTYEAYRIFNINYDKYKRDHFNFLNNYFKDNFTKINIFSTDKGQCIIGYEIHEISDVWNDFINIDQFIILITNLRTKFAIETKRLGANLERITLEKMEGSSSDAEIVHFPVPYIIEYH